MEGSKKKASKGPFCVHGGFSIWSDHPMDTDNFERKLSAFFSTDVKGFSRLMRDDVDTTIRTITPI